MTRKARFPRPNGFLPQSLVLSSRKMRARPFPQLDLEWSASGAAGGSRKVAEHRCSLWKLSLSSSSVSSSEDDNDIGNEDDSSLLPMSLSSSLWSPCGALGSVQPRAWRVHEVGEVGSVWPESSDDHPNFKDHPIKDDNLCWLPQTWQAMDEAFPPWAEPVFKMHLVPAFSLLSKLS